MKVTRKAGKIEDLRLALAELDARRGKVGWFESARTEEGAPMAGVAYVQEHGSTKRSIPPRPFMRPTATSKRGEWAEVARRVVKAITRGQMPADSLMEAVALKAEGDVRVAITKVMSPPLSPLTLLARKDRRDAGRASKKAAKFGPQPRYKLGGKRLGELANKLDQGPQDLSGVSTKPLVDSGLMLNTLTSVIE